MRLDWWILLRITDPQSGELRRELARTATECRPYHEKTGRILRSTRFEFSFVLGR
jgi:hypothetical protein